MKTHSLKQWASHWFRAARRRVLYRPASRAAEDVDPAIARTIQRVAPYTLTSPERIAALCQAVTYVAQHGFPGAVVECGVWRGGSMMAVAETLMRLRQPDRDLYLFDTFDGMTLPGDQDVDVFGKRASELLKEQDRHDPRSIWCVSPLEEVRSNMQSTGYPHERIHFVPGRVEETLPGAAPEQISILRLDTDWYESTRHELEQLFPRVVPGGVLIIDDYGHWDGARRAVDEYLRARGVPILLHRIDYTGRIGVVFTGPERSAA